MTLPRLLIWGASGHARVVADAVRASGAFEVEGFLDDINPGRHGSVFCGAPVLGGRDAALAALRAGTRHVVMGFGHNRSRLRTALDLRAHGFELPAIVHPTAFVAHDAELGEGCFIAAGARVCAGARVGRHAIVNTGVIVEHECVLQDGVHLSSAVCLAGDVQVGECAWVGAGAIVKEKLCIGADSVVGMGSIITRAVPDGVVVYGSPARVQRKVYS